ncbi:MAG: hypothetical protein L3J47_07165 [Sulfurovum sp.]|nr:hypothetical protein [Sulfurovum sp.]
MGFKRKKSEVRKRQAHIMIRVSEEEKEQIRLKAKLTGHPHRTGTFIRKAVLNYPLRSVVDEFAVDQLLQSRADLGRLGGLFKLWLTTHQDDRSARLGEHGFQDVEALVQTIEKQQSVLLEYAKALMKFKKS